MLVGNGEMWSCVAGVNVVAVWSTIETRASYCQGSVDIVLRFNCVMLS